MVKWMVGLGLGVGAPALALLLLFMALVALIGGSTNAGGQGCAPSTTTLPATYKGKSVGSLTPLQMSRAAAVVNQGRRMGIPDRGIVVALATAAQESRFKVYANDGRGNDLQDDQLGVGKSMKLPHDAVGTDHGSVGVFQQQWPWWGSMADLMDPTASARIFYEALRKVEGWESMPVTVAAQTVQSSAYPSAYADEQALAEELLAVLGDGAPGAASLGGDAVVEAGGSGTGVDVEDGVYVGGTADCVTAAAAGVHGSGAVVRPLPADSGYVDQHNFGRSGGRWSKYHTGNDYSVACGTKVLAVHAGTVEFDESQASWAGGNFVRISTGPGKLATWYAHMSSRTVQEGDRVTPGQQIGTVGSEGNSTGCHLHFEVHPRGGSIYEDPVDPVAWLAKNLNPGKKATAVAKIQKLSSTPAPGTVRVASFNALGHSHTKPGGNRPGWPSAQSRTRRLIPLLARHDLDLIGFQEFQVPQAKVFRRVVGDEWAIRANRDNSVAWRRDKFTLVSYRTLSIPYFHGAMRKMPVVRLRVRATGEMVTVISIHNPADARGPAGHWRERAERIERRFARAEQSAGRAVVLMGDFNARASTFCTITKGGVLHASAGGSHQRGRCQAPSAMEIDWIFASSDARFAGYLVDRASRKKRLSDHNLIVADLNLDGSAAPRVTGDLTVLSLDLAHGAGGMQRISEAIENSGAHVVALQRADGRGRLGELIRQLADRLGMQYAYTATGRYRGRRVVDNAILSRYPIVDAEHETIPAAGGRPRGLLRATLAVGRARMDVYATHLDHKGPVRRRQARAVAAEVGNVSCSTVLLGSLNLNRTQLALQGVLEELLDSHRRNGMSPQAKRTGYVLHDHDTRVLDADILPRVATGTRPVRASLRLSKEASC